jgi:hypothetical protein
MPGRASLAWDDIIAVGIEDPRGHNAGALYRIQGAILAQIPARVLVQPFIPSEWRRINGLPGNCPKAAITERSFELAPRSYLGDWPQDAHDAHLIALATRSLLGTELAA